MLFSLFAFANIALFVQTKIYFFYNIWKRDLTCPNNYLPILKSLDIFFK